jgi:hypothetical protein
MDLLPYLEARGVFEYLYRGELSRQTDDLPHQPQAAHSHHVKKSDTSQSGSNHDGACDANDSPKALA